MFRKGNNCYPNNYPQVNNADQSELQSKTWVLGKEKSVLMSTSCTAWTSVQGRQGWENGGNMFPPANIMKLGLVHTQGRCEAWFGAYPQQVWRIQLWFQSSMLSRSQLFAKPFLAVKIMTRCPQSKSLQTSRAAKAPPRQTMTSLFAKRPRRGGYTKLSLQDRIFRVSSRKKAMYSGSMAFYWVHWSVVSPFSSGRWLVVSAWSVCPYSGHSALVSL